MTAAAVAEITMGRKMADLAILSIFSPSASTAASSPKTRVPAVNSTSHRTLLTRAPEGGQWVTLRKSGSFVRSWM